LSKKKLIALIVAPLLLFYVSLFMGRYIVGPATVMRILLSRLLPLVHDWPQAAETIVIQIRLPRAILAMCVGAGLSASGAAFQGMFRNPLVSTDILGVSSASGFGAALAILLSAGALEIQAFAFAFGLLGVTITYLIARVYKTTPVLMLVLSGIVVAGFFNALISGAKYVADPEAKLPEITYWLLGSLNRASLKDLFTVVPLILSGCVGLLLCGWKLNVLSMGEEEARSLGVSVEPLKILVIICGTVITAASVSVCGIIGWVGLVIPHVGRMVVGQNHRRLIPACLALGATFLLFVDDIARTVTAQEIPIGILTALIGAPFFAFLFRKTKGGQA
jgi:iron complex transport system permease protein